MYKCNKCGVSLDEYTAYEYRGVLSCEEHFDEVIEMRDYQRNEIINEENNKIKGLKGLDLSDSIIGVANKKLLSRKIEVVSKESGRIKEYEERLC